MAVYPKELLQQVTHYADIGWLPEGSRLDGLSSALGKGPLISVGVQKGWLLEVGCFRTLSDIVLIALPKECHYLFYH